MRIIAGTLKGRRLEAPDWAGLRPTSDRLRETLFNILAPRIRGARVLDGYAGTGAIGIEALSRGAAHVTFVEQRSARGGADRGEPAALRRDRPLCYYPRRLCRTASAARRTGFDLIILDPPYGAEELPRRRSRRPHRWPARRRCSSSSTRRATRRRPSRRASC